MGYYTTFEVRSDRQRSQIIKRINEISDDTLDDDGDMSDCKWYDHEEILTQVSKEFPRALITVNGYGEERGDVWRKYFLNGNMEEHRFSVDLFPDCTLARPQFTTTTVYVSVAGVDVPIEVEHMGNENEDGLYAMAKAQLKALL